jgi:hypothetical protein
MNGFRMPELAVWWPWRRYGYLVRGNAIRARLKTADCTSYRANVLKSGMNQIPYDEDGEF